MSRFARDIRLGSHVQQGAVIGYVGMTGLATGPHLHYEYLMRGVHMDPQTVKLPGADPLAADALGRFRAQTASYLADLGSPHAGPATAAQSSSTDAGGPVDASALRDGAPRTDPPRVAAAADKALGYALPPGFSVAGMAQYVGGPRGAVN